MPKQIDTIHSWSIRITPSDQQPITNWSIFEKRAGTKVIIAEEGGNESQQLHYHGYVEGLLSETYMRTILPVLGRANEERKGNVVFSCKPAHEGTIGYLVKEGNIVYRLNYTDTHIEEYMEQSEQYRKDLETSKKREVRKKQSFLQQAVAFVKDATAGTTVTTTTVYQKIRNFYGERPMPSRSVMETAIVSCMDLGFQQQYFLKNLSNIYTNA